MAGDTRPNILLIILDATRTNHLSCYGYARQTTPNLDLLAREGVLYENCITPGSWTLPSLASLFTGLYPRDHGVCAQNLKLDPSHVSLAELLKPAGYLTVGFSSNAWVGKFSGLDQGFDEFVEVWRALDDLAIDEGAALTNARISQWLDRIQDHCKPFLMFVHYFEPHLPYRPPPPFDRKFLPAGADPQMVEEVRKWAHPREVGYSLRIPGMEVSPAQFEILTSQYDGEIAYLDQRVADLLSEFRDREILDNTVVVVTSDHGEHLGDHGLMDHKMSLYDTLIHVPLIVRYPPAVPSNQRVRSQVQTIDLFSTLLDLCRIEPPGMTASRVLPFRDVADSSRPYTFAEFGKPDLFLKVFSEKFPGIDYSSFDRSLKTVRTDRYKLIWASDGRHELYDIAGDPGETVNLYKSRADVAENLQRLLDAFDKGEIPE